MQIRKFFYPLVLLIIGILAFNKTFNLSLMGDEWQMMWVVKGSVETTGQWDYAMKLFNWQGYQFGALLMYLLTQYFGYDGKAVYIFSFITRFLAALTLLYFLRKRGCSNKAAFLGSLFFLITPIGLQATDWVKNFTSYISIIFFLLCIDFLYALKSWRNIFFFLISFSISIYVNPIRSPGIILTTTFLLIFQYLFNKTANKKNIIFLLFLSITIIFLFSKMLIFGGVSAGQQFTLALKQFSSSSLPIKNLFGSIGAALLPRISYYFLGLLIATLLLWKKYLLSKKFLLLTLGLHMLIVPILFGPSLHISNENMFVILGIYFTLFTISIFLIELFNKKIPEALNTSLPFLLVIFFLIAPLSTGTLGIEPTHRYMIYSALGLPIIVAFSLNQNILAESKKMLFLFFNLSSISFFITLFFLLMIYLSLSAEIKKLYIHHNQDTARILWQQITPYFDNYDFKNHRAVVFFDTTNGGDVHDTITFGFIFHMGYIYKIWVFDNTETYVRLPIAVDSLGDFNSMITDGRVLKKYIGQNSKPFIFPKEDAFYFKVDNLKITRIKDF